jgi:hypothetical protein
MKFSLRAVKCYPEQGNPGKGLPTMDLGPGFVETNGWNVVLCGAERGNEGNVCDGPMSNKVVFSDP